MRKLKTKNSISVEFFSKQNEIENYAQIGRVAHELFHDLLNPIAGFFLYMDLDISNLNEKELSRHHQEIQKSICRIKKFIGLIRENFQSQRERVEIILEKEIREIMSLLYYKAKRNRVSIVFIADQNIKIAIQKIKIYQIIINLLSNAIDSYESVSDSRKRQIVIKTSEKDDLIGISVKDNGCGIDKKNLDKIFNPNYTNKNDGFGIGLKTVREIVEDGLGGQIEVESVLDEGTEFRINFSVK